MVYLSEFACFGGYYVIKKVGIKSIVTLVRGVVLEPVAFVEHMECS